MLHIKDISKYKDREMLKIKVWKKYGKQVLTKRKIRLDILKTDKVVIKAEIIPRERRLPYNDKDSVHFVSS